MTRREVTTRDDQTGLMNMGAFGYVVDHVLRRAGRAGECATVLSIALDARGSPGPDPAAVYRVARVLRTELRGEDVVARIGESEFAVALPDTDATAGEVVVAWIEAKLAEHEKDALPSTSTVAIGRATAEPAGAPLTVEALLDAARASIGRPSLLRGELGADPPLRALQRRAAGRRQPYLRSVRSERR